MLGSSGQELLLWELRLVQERLNLKNSGLICKKSESREEESVTSIDSSPCGNDQKAPEVVSEVVLEEESDDNNVHECDGEQLEGDENPSDICNSVIHESESCGGASDGISDKKKVATMDILPQRSEVKRHYPVSIASDNFETMHLSEESSGEEEQDRGRFVRNGFGRISTVSSRSVGGAENFKVRKMIQFRRIFPGCGRDHHIQKCQKGSQCQVRFNCE